MRSTTLITMALFGVASMLALPAVGNDETSMYVEGYIYHYGGHSSIPGVVVSLYSPDDGEVLDSTTTDTHGFYQLRVLDVRDVNSTILNVTAQCHLRGDEDEFVMTLGTGIDASPVRSGLIVHRDMYFDRSWRKPVRSHGCGIAPTELENPIVTQGRSTRSR